MLNNRNYWLSWFLCVGLTVMAMMGETPTDWKWYFLSDLNVGLFLVIAWLFDHKR